MPSLVPSGPQHHAGGYACGRKGVLTSKSAIEGARGAYAAYSKQETVENIISGWGESSEILKVYELVPACIFVQTGIAIALQMARNKEISLENVDEIVIKAFNVAKEYPGVDNSGPFFYDAGQNESAARSGYYLGI